MANSPTREEMQPPRPEPLACRGWGPSTLSPGAPLAPLALQASGYTTDQRASQGPRRLLPRHTHGQLWPGGLQQWAPQIPGHRSIRPGNPGSRQGCTEAVPQAQELWPSPSLPPAVSGPTCCPQTIRATGAHDSPSGPDWPHFLLAEPGLPALPTWTICPFWKNASFLTLTSFLVCQLRMTRAPSTWCFCEDAAGVTCGVSWAEAWPHPCDSCGYVPWMPTA